MLERQVAAELEEVLRNDYVLAKSAYLDYAVYGQRKPQLILEQFEAALTHLVDAITDADDPTFEIRAAQAHLRRVAVEVREELCEEYFIQLQRRIDPGMQHLWVQRILFLPRTRVAMQVVSELNEIRSLISKGRQLKGRRDTFEDCHGAFVTAWEKLKELDPRIPHSDFWQRLWGVGLILIGFLLSLLFL